MLNVNNLRANTFFKDEGNLYQVITYEHIKMGRGSGSIKLKVKNLKTGSITEKGFITGAKVEEANVTKSKFQYLYHDQENYYFMDLVSFEQQTVSLQILSNQAKYLKAGLEVLLLIGEGEVLGIELPLSLTYEITDTGSGERGNTVSNVYKEATLDNGLVIKVPMFMKIGERVRVDTRSGDYIERVK